MTETTPRQVLYALVSGGLLVVIAVLVIGSAVAGLAPGWWTAVMIGLLIGAGVVSILRWQRTGTVLVLSIGLFVAWTVGTLLFA